MLSPYRFLREILPNFQFALTTQMCSSIFSAVYLLVELGFFSLLLASQFLFSCNANYCVFCVCEYVCVVVVVLFIVPNYLPMPLLGFLSNVCNHAEEINFDKTCRKKKIYENSYTRQAWLVLHDANSAARANNRKDIERSNRPKIKTLYDRLLKLNVCIYVYNCIFFSA